MSNRKPGKKPPLTAAQKAEAQAKVAAKAERRAERKEAERKAAEAAAKKRKAKVGAGVVVAIAIAALAIFGIFKWIQGENKPLVVPDGVAEGSFGVVVGQPDAPNTLVIYEDLQCPACRNLEATVGAQVNTLIDSGQVKVDYRVISFLDSASRNDYSSRAANALAATLDTAGVDAWKSLHDTMFAQQPAEGTDGPDNDELVTMAVAAGADEAAIRPLIEEGTFDTWVKDATNKSRDEGANSTPTVLVNGTKLTDPMTELPGHLTTFAQSAPTSTETTEPTPSEQPTDEQGDTEQGGNAGSGNNKK